MNSSSLHPSWYADQSALAAQELDFDLHMAAYEAEIRDGVNACFQAMPDPDPTPDNSVYNLNALLDSLD
ncbi:hypothetical protein WDZ92_11155 [Nostoc sp. NIES-2111]